MEAIASTATASTTESLPLVVRNSVPSDTNLILHSWLRSYRKSPSGQGLSPEDYYAAHHRNVDAILHVATVRVVHPEGAPDTILGWMAWEPTAYRLHYVYVKREFRRNGVARLLLSEVPRDRAIEYTHLVDSVRPWLRKHTRNWTYRRQPI